MYDLGEGGHTTMTPPPSALAQRRKKNEIIQMIMKDPTVAILDEPDSGLDIDSINTLADKLLDFASSKDDKVLIVITHYEKLIDKLQPDTVTIFKNKTATTHHDLSVAYDILENGFNG